MATPTDEDSYFPKLKNGKNLAVLIAEKFILKALKSDEREDFNYNYFHLLLKGVYRSKWKT